MVLIDALFIANEGGGPNLLRYLIDSIRSKGHESKFFLLLDERFRHDVSGFSHLRSKGALLVRRRFYQENKHKFTKVFCFANTPPPIRMEVPVMTYFHNQMLLRSAQNVADRRYLRFLLRYAFVALWNRNTDEYIVQTAHMVDEIVSRGLKAKHKCRQFPFYNTSERVEANFSLRATEFVYVSAASFYKNHFTLLHAWERLFEKGIKPVLHLTVSSDYPAVVVYIDKLRGKGVNIINHGYTDTSALYGKYAYMIYPSLNESFGLSLIEGANAGMKVLAADMPYVRSVINASAYFNPLSVDSITTAVMQALQGGLGPSETIINDQVNGLIEYILN